MHSSLFFQMITYFNLYYLMFFALLETALYIFKGISLPYPGSYVTCDLLIFMLNMILEYLRLDLGRKGNLTERQLPIIGCLFLTVPCVLAAVYFLLWQTYVLRIEIVLSGILFVFHGLEMLYCIILSVGFTKRSELT